MAAKKKTAKPYGNKTKFVMGLPRDLPAKQVVEKAKQQGIVISEAHVYKIRSTNKGKGAPSKSSASKATPAAPKGAKSAGRGNSSSGSSKRDFVLSFPPTTPASEILRKAKDSGIGLSKAYLYTIRNAAGAKPAGRGRQAAAPSRSAARAAASSAAGRSAASRSSGSLESQFIDAALDLGLSRASEILDRVRSRLKDL
jgi:hypothetical protein